MFATRGLPDSPDAIAPDGSEIRLIPGPQSGAASLAHVRLPPGAASLAVEHRTVEEVWHVTAGRGELWRAFGAYEEVAAMTPGVSFTIPLGTRFQFRCTSAVPLEFVIATFPPWPGESEAVRAADHWPVT